MHYGYASPGPKDLNAQDQIRHLKGQGCEAVFGEIDPGQTTRRELEDLFAVLEAGDTVTVTHLSRFGPSLIRVLGALEKLQSRNVTLISLDEKLDTSQPQHSGFFTHAKLFAACDQTLTTQRMLEGRAAAQRKGLRLGRKPKLNDDQIAHGRKLLALGETGRAVARTLSISEATLYRHIKSQ